MQRTHHSALFAAQPGLGLGLPANLPCATLCHAALRRAPLASRLQLRGGSSSPAHRDAVVAAAFSFDMTVLVTADKAGAVSFWPME